MLEFVFLGCSVLPSRLGRDLVWTWGTCLDMGNWISSLIYISFSLIIINIIKTAKFPTKLLFTSSYIHFQDPNLFPSKSVLP
jgi:hypothetical protein